MLTDTDEDSDDDSSNSKNKKTDASSEIDRLKNAYELE